MKTYIHVTCYNFENKEVIKKYRLKHFIERAGELVLKYDTIIATQKTCTKKEFDEIDKQGSEVE